MVASGCQISVIELLWIHIIPQKLQPIRFEDTAVILLASLFFFLKKSEANQMGVEVSVCPSVCPSVRRSVLQKLSPPTVFIVAPSNLAYRLTKGWGTKLWDQNFEILPLANFMGV